jgi:topoisomerase-4 subunit A
MLVFPVSDLPKLSKGKGNKLINIPAARAASREEYVTHVTVVPAETSVKLVAGKRSMTLTCSDIEHYRGERGRRGNKLPRGLQRVDSVEINYPVKKSDTSDS